MPISTSRPTNVTVLEDSHVSALNLGPSGDEDANRLRPPLLDQEQFEEIKDLMHQIKLCEREEANCHKKVEKIDKFIEEARESIDKGKKALEVLMRRTEFLQDKLDERERRVQAAVEYWRDYGLDVKQLSQNTYQFIYTKLSATVTLRYQDKRLEIVEQQPEAITNLAEFNDLLTSRCVQDDHVDYKLAMITIRKELVPKTSSRQ